VDSEGEEDDAVKPLSERLITELTTHRTLALRDALANDPGVAFAAMLHTICLGAFYRMSSGTCLEISAKSTRFNTQAPGLADSASAKAIEGRHQQWAKQLPQNEGKLWDVLTAFDRDSQTALLAHCASLSVNAVNEPWNRSPRRIAHADRLARAVNLDMSAAGWRPTVDGRVPKARILEAVREAKGDPSVQLIDHLKKPDMAREAEPCSRVRVGCPSLCVRPSSRRCSRCRGCQGVSTRVPDREGDGTDEQTLSDPEEAQSPAIAAE
jgi:ParB family transcriptional regulator, chromosome partitioning protein